MTTADSNGVPEDAAQDDPFAYLYRPAEGDSTPSQPPSNYARPMEVGRAQYGQPRYGQSQQQPPYGQPQQAYQQSQGQQQYGQQQAQVPQQSRYAERSRPQPGEETSSGRGKAAVIGAVAVIAAIAIGAGIALSNGGGDDKTTTTQSPTHTATAGPGHSTGSAAPAASASASADNGSGPVDASKLQGQGTQPGNSVKGAISSDGSYLTMPGGSSVTWTVSVPSDGQYKLWFHYSNAGGDIPAPVTVNGTAFASPVNLNNWAHASDPAQAWVKSWITPNLKSGSNTIVLSVPSGSVLLDQVALTASSVGDYPKH